MHSSRIHTDRRSGPQGGGMMSLPVWSLDPPRERGGSLSRGTGCQHPQGGLHLEGGLHAGVSPHSRCINPGWSSSRGVSIQTPLPMNKQTLLKNCLLLAVGNNCLCFTLAVATCEIIMSSENREFKMTG